MKFTALLLTVALSITVIIALAETVETQLKKQKIKRSMKKTYGYEKIRRAA